MGSGEKPFSQPRNDPFLAYVDFFCLYSFRTLYITLLFTRPLFVGTRGGAGFSTFSMSGLSVAVRGGVQMRYVASSSMSAFFFAREASPRTSFDYFHLQS